MKRIALIFVIAVLLPSFILAWLALRSLRDQQFLLERQQSLLCQRVTDSLANDIANRLAQEQQEFSAQVETLVGGKDVRAIAAQFDGQIRKIWPLAEVGFCVTTSGEIISPLVNARSEARTFYMNNGAFLGNREAVEVYGNANSSANNAPLMARSQAQTLASGLPDANFATTKTPLFSAAPSAVVPQEKAETDSFASSAGGALNGQDHLSVSGTTADRLDAPAQNSFNYKPAQARKVMPQSAAYDALKDEPVTSQQNLSRVVPAEAEFSQFIGNGTDGMLARFLQNKLNLMVWHRLDHEPDLIFGAQLNLNRVVESLRDLVRADASLQDEICLVLLDDNARPVILSRQSFQANWKRPFVATEIGDALPHWEIAAYLVNPAQFTQAAQTTKLMLGLLIAVLVLAIGVGSWLIGRSLNLELKLARQKTDFVSNVSHELKTPLTSIRMFSELLVENRVTDATKQKSYLQIITAEAARLTRLINNVLDFSRMERGEKKYDFKPCDLTDIVRSTCETFRPHLEANGFKFICELPEVRIPVRVDADAISQVLVNLLSNAEKYADGGKEIVLQIAQKQSPLPHAEVRVLDCGGGVPRGSEEKIFEKFYRAHDSLASGIQGSGLGLTIARQIARAHGGDVIYEPRDGVGGSCFILRLPLSGENA